MMTSTAVETSKPLDELGPVDYLIVEFPAGSENFTGEMAKELLALVDAGTIRVIDLLILVKDENGSIDAMELSDIEELGELQVLEAELAELLAEDDVRSPRRGDGPGQRRGRAHLREPLGGAVRRRSTPLGWPADRQRPHPDPGDHRLDRGRRCPLNGRRLTCHSDQDAPDASGVIGHPVAKTAVVAKAVTPGPSPVAKTAVVAAAVTPGRGRRRI